MISQSSRMRFLKIIPCAKLPKPVLTDTRLRSYFILEMKRILKTSFREDHYPSLVEPRQKRDPCQFNLSVLFTSMMTTLKLSHNQTKSFRIVLNLMMKTGRSRHWGTCSTSESSIRIAISTLFTFLLRTAKTPTSSSDLICRCQGVIQWCLRNLSTKRNGKEGTLLMQVPWHANNFCIWTQSIFHVGLAMKAKRLVWALIPSIFSVEKCLRLVLRLSHSSHMLADTSL